MPCLVCRFVVFPRSACVPLTFRLRSYHAPNTNKHQDTHLYASINTNTKCIRTIEHTSMHTNTTNSHQYTSRIINTHQHTSKHIRQNRDHTQHYTPSPIHTTIYINTHQYTPIRTTTHQYTSTQTHVRHIMVHECT